MKEVGANPGLALRAAGGRSFEEIEEMGATYRAGTSCGRSRMNGSNLGNGGKGVKMRR